MSYLKTQIEQIVETAGITTNLVNPHAPIENIPTQPITTSVEYDGATVFDAEDAIKVRTRFVVHIVARTFTSAHREMEAIQKTVQYYAENIAYRILRFFRASVSDIEITPPDPFNPVTFDPALTLVLSFYITNTLTPFHCLCPELPLLSNRLIDNKNYPINTIRWQWDVETRTIALYPNPSSLVVAALSAIEADGSVHDLPANLYTPLVGDSQTFTILTATISPSTNQPPIVMSAIIYWNHACNQVSPVHECGFLLPINQPQPVPCV